jgi:hypothetical protein
MKLAKTSLALLVIQLAIVSSIAANYLYERWTCPRVWTRTAVYDPEMLMRGRYLGLQLIVDGCGSNPPFLTAPNAPPNPSGVVQGRPPYSGGSFPAKLKVEGNRLVATRIPEGGNQNSAHYVGASQGSSCADLSLNDPVNFYIPENATAPGWNSKGHELWVEVTLPPEGPPRPIQLAVKENGVWKPLNTQ